MRKNTVKTAFIDSIPVLTGYVCLGFGFGILLREANPESPFGFWWALAMSVFIYAGSMQYVGITLLTGGVGLLSAALTTLLVNARHLFYGISMIDAYKDTGAKKPYLIFGLTDETYSLVSRQNLPEDMDKKLYFFLVTLFNQCYWIAGSVAGNLAGALIPQQWTKGVDFALTALFVTIVTEQWLSTKDHIPALIGLVSAAFCLFAFGSKTFLIPAMILIAAALILLRRVRKEPANA